jgi:hypothetical protein
LFGIYENQRGMSSAKRISFPLMRNNPRTP